MKNRSKNNFEDVLIFFHIKTKQSHSNNTSNVI